MGFPGSSAGKESAHNTGDPGSIPGWGGSPGEGIGYPLHFWPSLVAQLLKNLPAMQETWVWSLGWKDPLEKGMATHSSILAWRILWTLCMVHGVAKNQQGWPTFSFAAELSMSHKDNLSENHWTGQRMTGLWGGSFEGVTTCSAFLEITVSPWWSAVGFQGYCRVEKGAWL